MSPFVAQLTAATFVLQAPQMSSIDSFTTKCERDLAPATGGAGTGGLRQEYANLFDIYFDKLGNYLQTPEAAAPHHRYQVAKDVMVGEPQAPLIPDMKKRRADDALPVPDGRNCRELAIRISRLDIIDVSQRGFQAFSLLSPFTNVAVLIARESNLRDLAWLKDLPQLRALYLDGNELERLEIPVPMPQLGTLSVQDNRIGSWNGLDRLPNLARLDASMTRDAYEGNRIPGASLVLLSLKPTLRSLVARRVELRPDPDVVAALKGMFQVEELDLCQNHLADLEPFRALRNLKRFRVAGNLIGAVPGEGDASEPGALLPLSGLTNLEELDLSDNPISNVDPLSALTKLRELDLAATNVQNIRALASLPSMERFSLAGADRVQLDGLVPLVGAWPNLKRLDLRDIREKRDWQPVWCLSWHVRNKDQPTQFLVTDERVLATRFEGRDFKLIRRDGFLSVQLGYDTIRGAFTGRRHPPFGPPLASTAYADAILAVNTRCGGKWTNDYLQEQVNTGNLQLLPELMLRLEQFGFTPQVPNRLVGKVITGNCVDDGPPERRQGCPTHWSEVAAHQTCDQYGLKRQSVEPTSSLNQLRTEGVLEPDKLLDEGSWKVWCLQRDQLRPPSVPFEEFAKAVRRTDTPQYIGIFGSPVEFDQFFDSLRLFSPARQPDQP